MTSLVLFSIPIYLNSLRDQEIKEEKNVITLLPSEFILLSTFIEDDRYLCTLYKNTAGGEDVCPW